MSDNADTQSFQRGSESAASMAERPKPPDVLEREEKQTTNSLIQRLIDRLAV
jgi:hypothetical protein